MPPSRAELGELERLAAERARRSHRGDPIAFARALGIEPDPWQRQVLEWTGRRLLLNCHRQAGKSTTTSILALHRAIYQAGSLILLISPSLRQSKELLRKVVGFIPKLPVAPVLDEENVLSVEFGNRSRIISLPSSESTIRGFSAVSLVIEDEAGDVPDELNRAVRPMLAVSDGPLILMGTPKGRRGHFFDAWENGTEWERIEVKAGSSPRITSSFLDGERVALGAQYAQEYEASFINSAEGLVYGGYDRLRNGIDGLETDLRRPWRHLLGCDFGIVDPNAFTVLAYRDHDPCVYVRQSYSFAGEPSAAADEIVRLDREYRFEKIVGDVGGMGKAFQAEIQRRKSVPIHAALKSDKLGYIKLLNGDLREGKVKIVGTACRELLAEIQGLSWVQTERGEPKEDPGAANHCTDSFLYAWRDSTAYGNRQPEQPKTEEERIRAEVKEMWEADQDEWERQQAAQAEEALDLG